jgi:hypothetical protein
MPAAKKMPPSQPQRTYGQYFFFLSLPIQANQKKKSSAKELWLVNKNATAKRKTPHTRRSMLNNASAAAKTPRFRRDDPAYTNQIPNMVKTQNPSRQEN